MCCFGCWNCKREWMDWNEVFRRMPVFTQTFLRFVANSNNTLPQLWLYKLYLASLLRCYNLQQKAPSDYWNSSLSQNQIIAFIIAVFLCFLSYFAFEGLGDLDLFGSTNYGAEYLGISFHYQSISRGVIDTRDIIYFLSFIVFFLKLTQLRLIAIQKNS